MPPYEIVIYPSPILRKKSGPVPSAEVTKLQELILDMAIVMKKKDGLGLAAPQIGKNIQLAIINTKDGVLTLINPKITNKSWKKENGEEGCLSIPGVFGTVKRHVKIDVTTMDANGKEISFPAKGLFARVIQHEIDHINGVLFIDRTKKITRGKEILKKMKKVVEEKI